MSEPLRVISYGGGVQSTALVVLAGLGEIDYPVALFSNVGDDSEDPRALAYVEEHARPWADAHGITLHEIYRRRRDGSPAPTLYQELMRPDSRSIGIPVRMSNRAPGNRSCTADYKIRPVQRWLREHKATRANPAHVAVGFSTDELERASNRTRAPYEIVEYPLLDLRLSRSDCGRIITDAGLPLPPKSACYFCPYQRPARWAERRRDQPDLFWKAAELEQVLMDRREMLGKDPVYLTEKARPLPDAIAEAQTPLFDVDDYEGPDGCGGSSCFT